MLSLLGSMSSQVVKPKRLYLIGGSSNINYDMIDGFNIINEQYVSIRSYEIEIDLPNDGYGSVESKNEIDFMGYTKLVANASYGSQYNGDFRFIYFEIPSHERCLLSRYTNIQGCTINISGLKKGKIKFSVQAKQFCSVRAYLSEVYLTD